MKVTFFLLLLIGSAFLIWSPGVPGTVSAQLRNSIDLSPPERAFVAAQLAVGRDSVRLFIVTESGRSGSVANKLKAMSAEIGSREDDIDFIRARVPIARLEEILRWPELTAVEIDNYEDVNLLGNFDPPNWLGPGAPSVDPGSKPGAPPTADTPENNPYTGGFATESSQFKARFPKYDGRGVTIGGFERVNPRTPALVWARSLRGSPIPKMPEFKISPPAEVAVGPIPQESETVTGIAWQRTAAVVRDDQGHISFNEKQYSPPSGLNSDELRMTLFRPKLGGLPEELTVLWAVRSRKLWIVAKDQTDFNKGFEIDLPNATDGSVGSTLLGADISSVVCLAVKTSSRWIAISFNVDHGTEVASVATGQGFLSGKAEGVAPAARFFPISSSLFLQDYKRGSWPSTGFETLLDHFRNPEIDLLSYSGGVRLGFRSRTELDANVVSWPVLDRLTARYSKLLFVAAGNAGPIAQINEWGSTSDSIVAVGGYTPKETWEANFGITPTNAFTPAPYTRYGPASDGGLKPDVLALTGTLSAVIPRPGFEGAFDSPYYKMPFGYGLSGGTSAAAPNAAGNTALLISAAKQNKIPYDPERLRIALFSTAKFLDGVEARIQGRGLIQITQAWEALQRLKNYTPSSFVTEAPVHTFWSGLFEKPNVGRGYTRSVGCLGRKASATSGSLVHGVRLGRSLTSFAGMRRSRPPEKGPSHRH
jgi:hypothetical protein